MLFLSHGAQHKDAEQHCLTCGHQGLAAYVKAGTSGFGVSEAALNIIFYRYERCQSINEFSSSQGFPYTKMMLSPISILMSAQASKKLLTRSPDLQVFGTSKQPQDLASTFLELGFGFGGCQER